MTAEEIEQRFAALESAVRELQGRLEAHSPPTSWLERITGSFKDEPAFEEVLRYGREFCQADWPPEDDAGGERDFSLTQTV
jgi:hypothetical protein